MKPLPKSVVATYRRLGPSAPLLDKEIESIADYLRVLDHFEGFWFRGHADLTWRLVPSALRYGRIERRQKALELVNEFRIHAHDKLSSSLGPSSIIGWMQAAQHYGMPTRLLDWTTSEAVALYFACLNTRADGLVCMINPATLNRSALPAIGRVIDPEVDVSAIEPYINLDARIDRKGRPAIAIRPTWNNSRIQAQEGTFTLHGNQKLCLDESSCPSLVYVPIRRKHKRQLLSDLDRLGKNEMTLFPEPDKISRHLRRKANL